MQSQNFWASGNNGIRAQGGLNFAYMPDRAHDNKEVITAIVGGKAFEKKIKLPDGSPGVVVKAPWWAKLIPAMIGNAPSVAGKLVKRGSIITETVGNRTRLVMTAGIEDTAHYVTVQCGLDAIADESGFKSTANHRTLIEKDIGDLVPWGVIAFDSDALKLLTAEQGSDQDIRDAQEVLRQTRSQPDYRAPTTKAEQLGKEKRVGKYIASIDCFEQEITQWKLKPKEMLLKGMPNGVVCVIRLKGGILTETPTNDQGIRRIFYNGVKAEKTRRRLEAIANRKVLALDGNAVSEADAATDAEEIAVVSDTVQPTIEPTGESAAATAAA